METYLYIENGLVTNAINWDGVTEYPIPDNVLLIPAKDTCAWIGWTYDGENFNKPITE